MPLVDNNKDLSEKRLRLLQIIFVAVFLIYTVRLFAMQIVFGDLHRSRADTITRRSQVIPAERGEIYTSEFSRPVVYNTDSFAVRVSPAEIGSKNIAQTVKQLAAFLELPSAVIERKLPPQTWHLFEPIEVASNISFSKITTIAEHIDALPGVSWQSKPMRNYSNTGSLAHVIGYVGDITKDELTTLYNEGYNQNDTIGKAGIERRYDKALRGKNGQETRVVDVKGRITGSSVLRERPEAGKNLVLTIDRRIQLLSEKALGNRIGAVVVTRPSTGEILAMVSYPWYNPSVFLTNDTGTEYQKLLNNEHKPLLNRAIQSNYPPGSTFKIVMTTGVLAENAISSDKTIDCPGEITYGDRTWKCHIKKPGHGRVNLRRGLAQSCDIYYWVVGRDYLGIDNIVTYAMEYGFGETSGIDLPGEVTGFVPTPKWKAQRFHEKWLGGDTMNVSIGQGATLVTPLQMSGMVAMVANNGVIYKPHLLKEIRDPANGNVIETVQREVLRRSGIDKRIFARVREDMRGVISEGTAQYPLNTVKAVEIAGKTGTSEVGLADRWHAWFAAFAPYETENPQERIAVSIIVEAANPWEWWAVYAASIIFQGVFANQTYEEAIAALHFQWLPGLQERRE
ncbi:MAG: penicillin-binding protein 2 [Spirochaetaceae bacterium]|jgi:penicillin-binding protein 2|nr:penicillin-binding protein 2 [Spirochaetaceae bacterium]GMO14794.1 MAG: penicillin-binding protein 2 [Termitinemataceae bacterium]